MFWLAPDTVPTLGDWFRAGGYRTYYKGKWHASHAHLDAEDGDGFLLSIDDDGHADRGQHPAVPRGRPARRLRLLGVGRARAARARQAQHRHCSRTRSPPTRRSRCSSASTRRTATTPWLTVCSFLNPHDDSMFGADRAHAGAALPPLAGAARRAGTDARRGPLDEALLPAELRRQLGHDHRAAAVDRDPPEVLLPDAGRGRRADHARARRPARERGLREHDRDLQLRSRRHAGRPRRDAREVARRLRGGAARAVHRLQPAAARRRPRARHPDQPRRPDPDAARARRHRPRPGARPRCRPTTATPTRSSGATSRRRSAPPSRPRPAEPILFTTDDEISEGSETDGEPVRARRQGACTATRPSSSPTTCRP